jgi:hypothetical protein
MYRKRTRRRRSSSTRCRRYGEELEAGLARAGAVAGGTQPATNEGEAVVADIIEEHISALDCAHG